MASPSHFTSLFTGLFTQILHDNSYLCTGGHSSAGQNGCPICRSADQPSAFWLQRPSRKRGCLRYRQMRLCTASFLYLVAGGGQIIIHDNRSLLTGDERIRIEMHEASTPETILLGCCPVDVCVVVPFLLSTSAKLALGVVRGDVCACHTAKHGDETCRGSCPSFGEKVVAVVPLNSALSVPIFDGILCPVARDVGEGACHYPQQPLTFLPTVP